MSQAIQLINSLFVGTWLHTKDNKFITNNNIGLIIYSPTIVKPELSGINGFLFDCFEEDEDKFSSLVLNRKCQEVLIMINKKSQNCQNAMVCDFAISSTSGYICCLILMTKFKWNLLKTLQYIIHKIPTLHIDRIHTKRLLLYDKNFSAQQKVTSNLWDIVNQKSQQSLLARNTYMNSVQDFKTNENTNKLHRRPKTNKKIQFKKQGDSKYITENSFSERSTKFSQKYNVSRGLFISIPNSQLEPSKPVTNRVSVSEKRYHSESKIFRISVPQVKKQNLRYQMTSSKLQDETPYNILNLRSIQEEKINNIQTMSKIEGKIKEKFKIHDIRKKTSLIENYRKVYNQKFKKEVPKLKLQLMAAERQSSIEQSECINFRIK